MKKIKKRGFGLRLFAAIVLLIYCPILFFLFGGLFFDFLIYGVLLIVFSVLGRKYKWADVVCIVLFAIECWSCIYAAFALLLSISGGDFGGNYNINIFVIVACICLLGLAACTLGIIGGALGVKSLKKIEQAAAAAAVSEEAPVQAAEGVLAASEETAEEVAPAADYSEAPRARRSEEKIRLDVVDTSIHSKQWKAFRKQASEEELYLLAIGSKYRLTTTIIISLIFAIGMVVSVIVGIALISASQGDAGLIVLVAGYLLFSFLGTKHIRYDNTYSDLRGSLSSRYKKALDSLFNLSMGMKVLDFFVTFALVWLTIPYQFILWALEYVAPRFVVAKNGALITIPKGCGLDSILAVGEYYSSVSLLDEMMENSYAKSHKYTVEITNDAGCRVTLHSADNVHFKDDNGGSYIREDGNTIRKV